MGQLPSMFGPRAIIVLNADASMPVQLPPSRKVWSHAHWLREADSWRCESGPLAVLDPQDVEDRLPACMLGLRDYVNKNGFPDVVLGLSGGIDSAICAALAVDALGRERVRCRDAALPLHLRRSRSTDAAVVAKASGHSAMISCRSQVRWKGLEETLKPLFAGTKT